MGVQHVKALAEASESCLLVNYRFNSNRSRNDRDWLLVHAHKGYPPSLKIINTVIIIFAR